jgi:hypothetical protein
MVVIAPTKPSIKVNEQRKMGANRSEIPPHGMPAGVDLPPRARSGYEFAALYWFTGD